MGHIFKYTLSVGNYATGLTKVAMPKGAKVLSVHEQRGEICVWALVDINQPKTEYPFYVYVTGFHVTEDTSRFLGTVHLEGGSLVFHVFMGEP